MSNPYLSTPIRDDADGLFFHYFIVNNVQNSVQQKWWESRINQHNPHHFSLT